jgi:adenylate cyclase
MTFQTPALVDLGAPGTDTEAKPPTWFAGIGVRQVRIAAGLVMFSYIFSHFFNHALGNISYAAMEWWLIDVHIAWWRLPIVNAVLYAAALTHMSLGLWALYQRRHFRYTAGEVTQLALGLSIPLLLASHFGAVRVAGWLSGRGAPHYDGPLYFFWALHPDMIAVQFILLTVAWTHACIGLYFWLRLKTFFQWAAPLLLAVAVLMPPLAMIGVHHAAREVIELAKSQEWRNEHFAPVPAAEGRAADTIMLFYFPIGYLGAIGLIFAARGARSLRERRRGMVTIAYPDRKVRVPKGLSVLEASLRFKIPHASVCGGRARCSTCRIRILGNRDALPRPSAREAFVLDRVGARANPAIRLACQLRPKSDIAVIPIFPPTMNAGLLRRGHAPNIGKERYIVSMFVDMRGSTKLAEARLPFDVVFLINRFLGASSQAAIDAGGQPNQFLGDGLLALFGLDVDRQTASRQVLRAAAKVAANVDEMNRQFASDLREPIQFGIGIHGGEVIVGDIGFKEHTVFTALGDPVNVAARLQDMTKALNCVVVVSEEVCLAAGIASDALTRTTVEIRGRAEPMVVRTASDPAVLTNLLESAFATR